MRRRSLLAFVPLALSIAGALLLPGPAWACKRSRSHAHHVTRVARACRTVAYRPAVHYVAARAYARCARPIYAGYTTYCDYERPRYVRNIYDYDDCDDYAYRRCERPRYYASYRREYCDDDYYVRRCRPRRPSVEVYVNLGAVFGIGRRHCR